MTRKDYEIIARGIARARGHWVGYHQAQQALNSAVEQIAIGLAADNPQFSRERFMAAAAVIPSEVQP